jgi:hypothetical protein
VPQTDRKPGRLAVDELANMLLRVVHRPSFSDICEYSFGEDIAVIGLTLLLVVVQPLDFRRVGQTIALHWLIVALAQTVGTTIGDWRA